MTEIQRGYKVKIYPNKEQEQKFLKTVGACRFVYNHFLERKKTAYIEEQKNITYKMLSKELTKLRKETDWLQCVQFQPLQQSLRNLDVAYNKFFRKQSKFPTFHTKYGKQSFRKVTGWSIDKNKINIGRELSVRFRGEFPVKRQGTLTISRDAVGDWYASTIGIEQIKPPRLKKEGIGLDFGLNHIVITSEGEKYENPHVLK